MPVDILCIGHAAYDISFFVDEFPSENSKGQAKDVLETCGGPAANAAYLLSKWSVSCAFAGLVGDDSYGHRIVDSFRSVGTDVSCLEVRPGLATPLSMILVNGRNGSRTIVNRTSSSDPLMLETSRTETWSPSVLLFDGHAPEASLAALEAFPQATSVLDAGSWREGTAVLAGKVDYLAASERFGLQATDLPDLNTDDYRHACLERLRARFNTTAIVTLGEEGLIARQGDEMIRLSAFPVDAVDTTAAGDIFHGAFAFGLYQSMSLRENLRFASMAAALSVRQRGGRSSIPDLTQVRTSLRGEKAGR